LDPAAETSSSTRGKFDGLGPQKDEKKPSVLRLKETNQKMTLRVKKRGGGGGQVLITRGDIKRQKNERAWLKTATALEAVVLKTGED